MLEKALPEGGHELIDREALLARIAALALEIDQAYQGTDFVVVGVLKGAHHFLSDLLLRMTLDPRVEFVRVATYGDGTYPTAATEVTEVGELDLGGRDVLVIEDILDRGGTAGALTRALANHSPKSLRWAFLLVKEGAIVRSGLTPDFVGFTIPDEWVVGYGLDVGEQFRNLEGIYTVAREDREV